MSSDADAGDARPADATGRTGEAVLAVEDLAVSYGQVAALRGVDLRVEEGSVVAVIGPNGAGKSTLADAVSGFRDYQGSVRYRGREVGEQSTPALVGAGLVHCTETRDLFDYLSVEQNLRLGAYRRGDDATSRLEYVYELFPALAERTDQHARTLSGGEQQMVAIGRALMGDPDLLVLDEPTLGLAPVVVERIDDAFDRMRETGVTVLLAEQNVTFAMRHADRVALLENGSFAREGSPEALRGDEYVQDAYLGG